MRDFRYNQILPRKVLHDFSVLGRDCYLHGGRSVLFFIKVSEPSNKSFSSPEFLERLRKRDHDCVTEVVRAYTKHLFRAALGLGFDQEGANELVQRVWATFFDVLPNFRAQSHVRTFLFGILYNKASELRREGSKMDSLDPIDEVMERRFTSDGQWQSPPVSPEKFAISVESLGEVEDCLSGLNSAQRSVFWLKEVEELSSEEICNALSLTSTNLRVLLFRARNKLRECLEAKAKEDTNKRR